MEAERVDLTRRFSRRLGRGLIIRSCSGCGELISCSGGKWVGVVGVGGWCVGNFGNWGDFGNVGNAGSVRNFGSVGSGVKSKL